MRGHRVALLAVMASTGCRTSSPNPTFDAEARAVSEWISQPGVSSSPSEDERRGMVTSRTWEVSVPMTWPAYRERLRGAASRGYHERGSTSADEAFTRVVEGDVFLLSLHLLSSGSPIRVRVNLTAMPD